MRSQPPLGNRAALEATQGQMDGFYRQLQYKCYFEEVASVGDSLKICLWVAFGVETEFFTDNLLV